MTKDLKTMCERLFEIADNMSDGLEIVSPSPLSPLEVHSNRDRIALFAGCHTWNAEAFVSFPEAITALREYQRRERIAVEALKMARIMATEAYLAQDGKSIIAASDFKDIEQCLLGAIKQLGGEERSV